ELIGGVSRLEDNPQAVVARLPVEVRRAGRGVQIQVRYLFVGGLGRCWARWRWPQNVARTGRHGQWLAKLSWCGNLQERRHIDRRRRIGRRGLFGRIERWAL